MLSSEILCGIRLGMLTFFRAHFLEFEILHYSDIPFGHPFGFPFGISQSLFPMDADILMFWFRSSSAHWDPELAMVRVQHCPVGSGARDLGFRLQSGGVHGDLELGVRARRKEEAEEEEVAGTTDLKSNSPDLAGGEKQKQT